MALSDDLISQFVKATKDDKKSKEETTVYGAIKFIDNTPYVQIDGSELYTPATTTAEVKDGERVTVTIKNHTAIVNGNVSSPAARTGTVTEVSDRVNAIEADYVKTSVLEAEYATIENLEATNAEIDTLKAKDAEIETLVAEKATIENLDATNAEVDKLKTKTAEIETLKADSAFVGNLNAAYASVNFANIDMAAVEKLFTKSGIIDDLVVSEGKITGELVGVTIKGDLIEGNTIVADKLVVRGEDGIYYKLNYEGGALEGESAEKTVYYKVEYDEETDTYSHSEEDVGEIVGGSTESIRVDAVYTTDGLEVYSLPDLTTYSLKQDDNGNCIEVNLGSLVSSKTVDDSAVFDDINGVGVYLGELSDGTEVYYTDTQDRVYELDRTVFYYCVKVTYAEWAGKMLHGSVITAKSIVADQITVTDLVAFGATIGGFQITDKSIHSGVKTSVDNSTQGIYIDDDGQLCLGDETNYLKYYRDKMTGGVRTEVQSSFFTTQKDNVVEGVFTTEGSQICWHQDSDPDSNEPIGDVVYYTYKDGTPYIVTPKYSYKLDISADSVLFGVGDKSSMSDIKTLTEHIKIGTWTDPETGNDNPSIELSEGDSEFKQLITNEASRIMDGDNVVTEMDSEGVETDNVTVREELRQGSWVWTVHGNGNLGLMWKEVSS